MTSALKQFWERLSPDRKRQAVIGGGILGFLAISWPFLSTPPPKQDTTARPENIQQLLTSANTRELGLSGLSSDLERVKKTQNATLAELEKIRTELGGGQHGSTGVLLDEINALRGEIEALRAAGTGVRSSAGQGDAPPAVGTARGPLAPPPGTVWNPERPTTPTRGPAGQGQGQAAAPARRPIRSGSAAESTAVEAAAQQATAAKATPAVYIPSGSIVTGVLLNGLDAPTARGSKSEPIPVVVRIKHEAILPSRGRLAEIRECHMIAAGVGDLPSERAYLRSEKMSCIRADGGAIDIPVEMYAVGEDSKTGLRGNLVSKQGQIIGRALLAGFAEGVSNAFSRSYSPTVTPYGTTGGSVDLQSGFAGGTSSALDRIAQYYLDMANQLFPVIEISGGRQVSFVVLNGTEIPL